MSPVNRPGRYHRRRHARGREGPGSERSRGVHESRRHSRRPVPRICRRRQPRPVTYAEASSVLPFRNRIVVQTMTGRTIKDVLEQQFDNVGPGQDRILQVSRGFSYAYDRTASKSRRVDPASITIDGRQVVPSSNIASPSTSSSRPAATTSAPLPAAAASRPSAWISMSFSPISANTRRSSASAGSHQTHQIARVSWIKSSRSPQDARRRGGAKPLPIPKNGFRCWYGAKYGATGTV